MLSENPIQKSSTFSNKLIQSERIIGIDIVKIVAIFLVTLLHITGIGGAIDAAENPLTNFLLCSLNGVSFCCINLFALATGFLYYNRKNRYSKLLQLWIQVVFWAVFANIIPALYYKDLSILTETPFVRIFVVSFLTYWYVDAYFVLFLFIPMLNAAIEKMNKKSFVAFFIISSVLLGVIPFLFNNDIANLIKGYSFAWLAYLFLLGAGIKKFDYINRIKSSVLTVTVIISALIQILTTFICRNYKPNFMGIDYSGIYENYNFIIMILFSLSLFLLIARIKVKNTKIIKIICAVSSAAFSVYLIQCNHSVLEYLIDKHFSFLGTYSSIAAFAAAIGISLAIYIIFTILGILQNKLFNICRINKLCDFIELTAKKVFDLFYSKILSKCVKN